MTYNGLRIKLLKYIEDHAIWPYLTERKFQAYCVGTPKSGTLSIARIFRSYRAAHEPRGKELTSFFEKVNKHEFKHDKIKEFISDRDKKLFLELESFHTLAWFSNTLVDMYPNAKFVLPIRPLNKWLDSIINQHLNFNDSNYPEWRKLRDIYHKWGGMKYSKHDRILKKYDLYPLDNYLSYWLDHNRYVINTVPIDRLFVLNTHDIDNQIHNIAQFIGVSRSTLDHSKSHSHKAPEKHNIVDDITPDYLNERIAYYSEQLDKYLPQNIRLQ